MDLMQNMKISAGGLHAQSTRMRVIAENIANKDSIETESGGPYRRQMVHFKQVLDRETGASKVTVDRVSQDYITPFKQTYEPGHPMADEKGFVAYPNVNSLQESVDMREATRAYEANMAAIEAAKQMMVRSIDMIR